MPKFKCPKCHRVISHIKGDQPKCWCNIPFFRQDKKGNEIIDYANIEQQGKENVEIK